MRHNPILIFSRQSLFPLTPELNISALWQIMHLLPLIAPHNPECKYHNANPPNSHPRKQHSKILTKMALRPKDDGTSALDGIEKRETVSIEVEARHEFERGEGRRYIDNYPCRGKVRCQKKGPATMYGINKW